MVIALHNIAVEHEHLKQYMAALSTYKKAKDTSALHLGPEHQMTQKMSNILEEASNKIKGILDR
jgi:hypothetical protein